MFGMNEKEEAAPAEETQAPAAEAKAQEAAPTEETAAAEATEAPVTGQVAGVCENCDNSGRECYVCGAGRPAVIA